MEEGFGLDRGYGESHVAGWHPGKPDRRWWGLKSQRRKVLAIVKLRCTRCGYLESYAN